MDRLTSMRIYVQAVELGSFSAAAAALDLSPQLVGKHVQALEQHLGVRLLNRTTRRQGLTDIGRIYYERAKIILAEVDAADSLAAESRAVPRGRLRVNAPVSFGIHLLAARLPVYMRRYPEVSVDLTLANRRVDLIDEGYDVVFRIGELADSRLMARALAPYRLILCAAPSYLDSHPLPTHPLDLRDHECLLFPNTALRSAWPFVGPDGSVSVPVAGRLSIDSGEALQVAVLAGLGIALQPVEVARADLAAGRLRVLLPDYTVPARPMHVLYAPDHRVTPKLRSFLDFAAAEFGSGDNWMDG
ncbi:LysR family transcriptional regulator [Nitrospirillum iridis]|uniref:DNA-binding transcriptional LysR family regulator n=1 Tax=Nitrospirillum iridis TaxID=765888 RepID=A0A7X0EBJ1_9PROT|nr:LysR family transcriptional regulator [Nitrospirillum iridis]MBB6250170.1 DNA-binding transcriptional LysR family regulator [Nitrospirillum iridis]